MSSSTIERCSSGSITTSSALRISSLLATAPIVEPGRAPRQGIHVAHSPACKLLGDRDELAPRLGQLEFHARWLFFEARARHQTETDHVRKPSREHARADTREAFAQMRQSRAAGGERQHDRQRPAIARRVQGARERGPRAAGAGQAARLRCSGLIGRRGLRRWAESRFGRRAKASESLVCSVFSACAESANRLAALLGNGPES